VTSVKITNVPSFLILSDLVIENEDLGMLAFDISYGGNFYAIVDPQDNFPKRIKYGVASDPVHLMAYLI